MARNRKSVFIRSILGGECVFDAFANEDQFLYSQGIDPNQTGVDAFGQFFLNKPSGVLSPVLVTNFTNTMGAYPVWMVTNPKDENVYIYDASGSVYSTPVSTPSFTGVGDLNDGGSATGNGCEYYDNYVYFARATTIARYGPLNGTPTLTDDYWVTTLGKTALTDTEYPYIYSNTLLLPNHVMKRHNDGRLYFADVVGNQGYLHYISTTKTTVEGDTDNGSKYQALDFPFGYYPTTIESFGDGLVIGLYSGHTAQRNPAFQDVAKIAFWDTNANNFTQIIDFEFPDPLITKIINSNGYLYVFSEPVLGGGFRVSRYLGGSSFEQVAYINDALHAPLPGAVKQRMGRIYFTTSTNRRSSGNDYVPILKTIGSEFSGGEAVFTVAAVGDDEETQSAYGTSLCLSSEGTLPVIGWGGWSLGTPGNPGSASTCGSSSLSTGYDSYSQFFISKRFSTEKPFSVKRVIIPLRSNLSSPAVGENQEIIPVLLIDNSSVRRTLATINYANYSSNSYPGSTVAPKRIIVNTDNADGESDFALELIWNSSDYLEVGLPIEIEYEERDI